MGNFARILHNNKLILFPLNNLNNYQWNNLHFKNRLNMINYVLWLKKIWWVYFNISLLIQVFLGDVAGEAASYPVGGFFWCKDVCMGFCFLDALVHKAKVFFLNLAFQLKPLDSQFKSFITILLYQPFLRPNSNLVLEIHTFNESIS